jgi:hypothetical protein
VSILVGRAFYLGDPILHDMDTAPHVSNNMGREITSEAICCGTGIPHVIFDGKLFSEMFFMQIRVLKAKATRGANQPEERTSTIPGE